MKKAIILGAVLLLHLVVFTQKNEIGYQIGISGSDTYGKVYNLDPNIGLATGIFYTHYITKKSGLRTGLYYEQKGGQHDDNISGTVGSFDSIVYFERSTHNVSRANYLTLPIQYHLRIGKFYLNAGPYFGLLIRSTTTVKGEEYHDSNKEIVDEVYDNKNSSKKLEIGSTFGSGINIPLTENLSLNIETRLNVALTSYQKPFFEKTAYKFLPKNISAIFSGGGWST